MHQTFPSFPSSLASVPFFPLSHSATLRSIKTTANDVACARPSRNCPSALLCPWHAQHSCIQARQRQTPPAAHRIELNCHEERVTIARAHREATRCPLLLPPFVQVSCGARRRGRAFHAHARFAKARKRSPSSLMRYSNDASYIHHSSYMLPFPTRDGLSF